MREFVGRVGEGPSRRKGGARKIRQLARRGDVGGIENEFVSGQAVLPFLRGDQIANLLPRERRQRRRLRVHFHHASRGGRETIVTPEDGEGVYVVSEIILAAFGDHRLRFHLNPRRQKPLPWHRSRDQPRFAETLRNRRFV